MDFPETYFGLGFRITSDIYTATTDFTPCKWKRHNILELLFRDIKFLVHIIIITHEISKRLPAKKSELPATQGEEGEPAFPSLKN